MTKASKIKAFQFLVFVGIIISSISIFHYAGIRYGFQTEPSFCNLSASVNCDAVNASKYALIFGVPIASLALFYYLTLFVFAYSLNKTNWLAQDKADSIFITISFASILFSAYLGYVSVVLIKAMCLTCIGLYVVNVLLFIISLLGTSVLKIPSSLITGVKEISALLFAKHKNSFYVLFIPALIFLGSFYTPQMLAVIYKKKVSQAVIISNFNKSPKFDFAINKSGLNKDAYKGNENAKVVLVEFADFECPACRVFSTTIEELLKEYEGKLLFVHKQFPLDNSCNQEIPQKFHKHACHAAYFVRCAGEQDKYWEAYNYIFTMPELDKGGSAVEITNAIDAGSSRLGLDSDAMSECISSKRHLGKIQNDIKEGIAAGLQGTPTLYINGRRVIDTSKEVLRIIIDSELKK